jgi:hypothetical protein
MFEYKMKQALQVILCVIGMMGPSLYAQDQSPIDFVPRYKKGDKMVYQLVETKFRQNFNGFFYYIQYDTSYLVFNVTEKNDSQVLMDFNYADAIINGKVYNEPTAQPNFLRSETYKLVFTEKGEFVELSNWEMFASVLIQNIKQSYRNQTMDSNALKYYYLYYHDQEKVEFAVIPRVLELFNIAGDTYNLETSYSLAREIVNPFGGNNLQKSCLFKPYKDAKFPNSVFFAGKIKTNSDDNECLQDDYYAFLNEKKPDADSDIVPPYIYMEDTYTYQWGLVNHLFMNLTTTHTVYFGSDKQGLDRVFRFYAN